MAGPLSFLVAKRVPLVGGMWYERGHMVRVTCITKGDDLTGPEVSLGVFGDGEQPGSGHAGDSDNPADPA